MLGVPGFWRLESLLKTSKDVQSLLKIMKVETALSFSTSSLGTSIAKCDLAPGAFYLKEKVILFYT